jgi:hypothetical protein
MSTALTFCPATDLARGACRTLGVCWGHECVGFADCGCLRCHHTRRSATERHGNHTQGDASYCGTCRTEERQRYDSRWTA